MWPKNGTTRILRWWRFYLRGGPFKKKRPPTARYPKCNSPWCHDSNPSSIVTKDQNWRSQRKLTWCALLCTWSLHPRSWFRYAAGKFFFAFRDEFVRWNWNEKLIKASSSELSLTWLKHRKPFPAHDWCFKRTRWECYANKTKQNKTRTNRSDYSEVQS